jgi:hypothetical protein
VRWIESLQSIQRQCARLNEAAAADHVSLTVSITS